MSRDAACNLERCIDSMWMLTTALFGSRLQGHECKRKTAEWSSEHASVLLTLSILTDTAHNTISQGKQGKRVYTIGPERRVHTIEASDPEKEERRISMVVVYTFLFPQKLTQIAPNHPQSQISQKTRFCPQIRQEIPLHSY